jgi:hypothetical protein
LTPLAGIDVHVHVHDERARALQGPEAQAKFEQMARYFKREVKHTSVEEQAEQYRSKNMMAVLVNGTDVTVTGRTGGAGPAGDRADQGAGAGRHR